MIILVDTTEIGDTEVRVEFECSKDEYEELIRRVYMETEEDL